MEVKMTWSRDVIKMSVVLLSTACLATAGYTQDIPKEGKFSATFTTVNPNPAKPVSLGSREVGVGSPIITVVNDTEAGFLHAMAGHCNILVDHNKTARTYQSEGYCNVANRDGDQLFLSFKTPSPVALGTTVTTKGQILGGTGKFAGVTGEFDIRRSPVLASEELVIAAGKMIGTYSTEK
jgi:hypothetical protein